MATVCQNGQNRIRVKEVSESNFLMLAETTLFNNPNALDAGAIETLFYRLENFLYAFEQKDINPSSQALILDKTKLQKEALDIIDTWYSINDPMISGKHSTIVDKRP